jgi:ceramide glucosyltransferase
VIKDFPHFDAKILVEDEDPALQDDGKERLGPNPKIRNMSRAYREAKGDIVWIIDCNVWVSKGVCGRMVDKLCGFSKHGQVMPYKFVHHLPLVVEVEDPILSEENTPLLQNGHAGDGPTHRQSPPHRDPSCLSTLLSTSGGRLEELFLSSSHAKFYTAINTVLIAPCIVGKSNMFRRSHLNHLTTPSTSTSPSPSTPTPIGIDHFSHNICEDHLIGDLLWRSRTPLPSSPDPALPATPQKLGIGNHALLFGDLAIQPMANMSLPAYVARRVRWLRVRKFTVTLATLVEPGTESFLCSAYGAFGLTTLPWFHQHLGIPNTWPAFMVIWLLSVMIWCAVDWTLYILLHSGASLEVDEHTPSFVCPPPRASGSITRRPFGEWLLAWLGREVLALPVWAWAVWGGVGVEWRGRRFWVGMDMRVHEIEGKGAQQENGGIIADGGSRNRSSSGGARGGRRKKRSD